MATLTKNVTVADLKRAIEARDARGLSGFYADDAVLRIIDHSSPPSKPRELTGKAAIAAFHDDVCGRAMTHRVEAGVADGDRTRLHAKLRLPRRPEGLLLDHDRAPGWQDRTASRGAGLGRMTSGRSSPLLKQPRRNPCS